MATALCSALALRTAAPFLPAALASSLDHLWETPLALAARPPGDETSRWRSADMPVNPPLTRALPP